jgi:2-polyprenyl-3-methyl-5-hydroxy-6-metoxy-1,4-benzoquinol methylase
VPPAPAFGPVLGQAERPASVQPPSSRSNAPPPRDSLPAGVGSASTPPLRPEISAPGAPLASATSTLAGAVAPAPHAFPAPPVGAVFPSPAQIPAPAYAPAPVTAPTVEGHERPPRESEPDLQLVDVEEAEALIRPRDLRSPPPPPPPPPPRAAPPVPPTATVSAGPASAPAKRPPPPPSANKVEEDRQKRKQVRQWWERFFSDDYLVTVLPPTQEQIAKQVDFIEASLGLAKGATVLDVGCGLGLQSIELARRGYLIVGLDLSLAMITRAAESAQQQNLKVSFVHADIREMEFDGAFDGVICMDTTFGFFDDDANRDVLARMQHALKPGGRMLLDVVNRDYVIKSQPNLVWFEGDECVCMEESEFNYFNSRLTVKRTMMREDGRQTNAEYSVRLYSLHELGQLVQQMGFRVIEVSGQEAIRGAFFGSYAPRILTLAERRTPGSRGSVVMPHERGSAEMARPSFAMTPERAPEAGRPSAAASPERMSAELPKPPKPE